MSKTVSLEICENALDLTTPILSIYNIANYDVTILLFVVPVHSHVGNKKKTKPQVYYKYSSNHLVILERNIITELLAIYCSVSLYTF